MSQSCSGRAKLKVRSERGSILCCTHVRNFVEGTADLGGVVAPVGGLVGKSDIDTHNATIEARLQPPGCKGISKGLTRRKLSKAAQDKKCRGFWRTMHQNLREPDNEVNRRSPRSLGRARLNEERGLIDKGRAPPKYKLSTLDSSPWTKFTRCTEPFRIHTPHSFACTLEASFNVHT